jgi:hypothetical protein
MANDLSLSSGYEHAPGHGALVEPKVLLDLEDRKDLPGQHFEDV